MAAVLCGKSWKVWATNFEGVGLDDDHVTNRCCRHSYGFNPDTRTQSPPYDSQRLVDQLTWQNTFLLLITRQQRLTRGKTILQSKIWQKKFTVTKKNLWGLEQEQQCAYQKLLDVLRGSVLQHTLEECIPSKTRSWPFQRRPALPRASR